MQPPPDLVGGALMKKMSSSAKGLLAGGLLLASTSSVLVKEPLAAGSLFLRLRVRAACSMRSASYSSAHRLSTTAFQSLYARSA